MVERSLADEDGPSWGREPAVDDQAFLDCGHHVGGHLRGGVPIVGTDGPGLMLSGPPAGLVAH